ncbi:hypothetical protein D3C81_442090 [compost metagenome]
MKPEELEAFLAAYPAAGCLEYKAEDKQFYAQNKTAYSKQVAVYANLYLGIWQSAIAFKEEQLKPGCEIWQNMRDEWRAVKEGTLNCISEDYKAFATEDEAVAYAKAQGYRRIPE